MITIKTKLADGIEGGGEVKTHHEYQTVGPLNLVKAIRQLLEHRQRMKESYGNIGCGSSWMEIEGQKVDLSDLEPIVVDERAEGYPNPIPCTQKAKYYLEDFYQWRKNKKIEDHEHDTWEDDSRRGPDRFPS